MLRHGNDESFGEGQNGRIQIEEAAKRMKAEFVGISKAIIYSSPLDRAVKSSNILREKLVPEIVSDEVITTDLLKIYKKNVDLLASEISLKKTDGELLIFVGHQPDFGDFSRRCGSYKSLKNGEYVVVIYRLKPTQ